MGSALVLGALLIACVLVGGLSASAAISAGGGEHRRVRHREPQRGSAAASASPAGGSADDDDDDDDGASSGSPTRPLAESERRLMLECQSADYRAYIKCLKREKRQHGGAENSKSCLDECFQQNCTSSACIRDCHSRCRKRLIETYSKTVETTYDCANGECAGAGGGGNSNPPNITTNVHIQNVIPEGLILAGGGSRNGSRADGDDAGTRSSPTININNVINNRPEADTLGGAGGAGGGDRGSSWDCPCPNSGCNCNNPYNQWQPQITIGIGGGPMGGCFGFWPCYQRYQMPAPDCSICANPFLRYQCDPACIPRNNTVPSQPKTNNANTQTNSQTNVPTITQSNNRYSKS